MNPSATVDELCAQQGLTPAQVAERTGLDLRRIKAIIAGNWTPSPAEREKIAAVFGVELDRIAWGHRGTVQHIQGHGPQFGRSP